MLAKPLTFILILVTTFLSPAIARPLPNPTAALKDAYGEMTSSTLELRDETESEGLGIAPKLLTASWPVISPLINLLPTEK